MAFSNTRYSWYKTFVFLYVFLFKKMYTGVRIIWFIWSNTIEIVRIDYNFVNAYTFILRIKFNISIVGESKSFFGREVIIINCFQIKYRNTTLILLLYSFERPTILIQGLVFVKLYLGVINF